MAMKNILKRLGALAFGALVLTTGIAAPVKAAESNYTYLYDYWGDVQDCPDFYTVCKVFTSSDLGLEVKLKNPQSLFVKDDLIYIVDTGNNRIVVAKRTAVETIEVVQIIDSFKGAENNTFNGLTDVAVDEDGFIYIADQNNARILKLDQDLNYQMEFGIPVDPTISPDTNFLPKKLVVDTAGRVYCIATGINKGMIKYESDGTFSGFVGATKAIYDWTTYIWKKFASQEQLALMESFVPTEYDNLFMDKEGFVYACSGAFEAEDLDKEVVDAIRKLNLIGNDILVRNGENPVYGDLYWGTGGGYTGPSYFTDVTVLDNDIYACLDKNRGRVFAYDDQGNIVYAFGGNGNMDGYFRQPSAIEHMNNDLMVLDAIDCSLTLFIPTEFGTLVSSAMEQFDKGDYEASGKSWEEVMKLDGNYTLAYIGIGRALLRQERYGEAMEYFELKYDDENYSKAYQQYRKEWVEKNIVTIVIVLLALFLIPMSIGKVKALKHEIDTADIFRL